MFLYAAAALLMGASLASCSSKDNNGEDAVLPTPTGGTKYLLKYQQLTSGDSVLVAKYVMSGNGLLLADTTYAIHPTNGSLYVRETRALTYGNNGIAELNSKEFTFDGTLITDEKSDTYTVTFTYSGSNVKEWYSTNWGYNHTVENGKVVQSQRTDKDRTEKYSYAGNDCTQKEYLANGNLTTTETHVFDDKKNPFYSNWFAFSYEALGEHNTKTSTRTYANDSATDVDFDVEYPTYNTTGYPTKVEVKSYSATSIFYTYTYVGW